MARRKYLDIASNHDAYVADEVGYTMTVGELISFLMGYDSELPVVVNNDRGYTFGAVNEDSISERYHDSRDDGEEDE